MFIYHLDNLIRQYEIDNKQSFSINQLADLIGISRQTLSKIKNHHITNYVTSTDIIEKLLSFFKCSKITDLIEYIPD